MYTSKMFGVHNIAYKLLLIMKWSQQNFEFDLLFFRKQTHHPSKYLLWFENLNYWIDFRDFRKVIFIS